VLIVDRARAVARLEPVTGTAEDDHEGRLSRLLRDGVVRLRRAENPRALLDSRPPSLRDDASGVDALIRDRWEGR
jgi:hypothetical protein